MGQFHSKYTAARAPQQRSLRHLDVCMSTVQVRPSSEQNGVRTFVLRYQAHLAGSVTSSGLRKTHCCSPITLSRQSTASSGKQKFPKLNQCIRTQLVENKQNLKEVLHIAKIALVLNIGIKIRKQHVFGGFCLKIIAFFF